MPVKYVQMAENYFWKAESWISKKSVQMLVRFVWFPGCAGTEANGDEATVFRGVMWTLRDGYSVWFDLMESLLILTAINQSYDYFMAPDILSLEKAQPLLILWQANRAEKLSVVLTSGRLPAKNFPNQLWA